MLLLYIWKYLEGQVVDVSGLEARAEWWIQWVSFIPRDRQAESNDSKVFTHPYNLPRIHLFFSVLLSDQHNIYEFHIFIRQQNCVMNN